MKIALFAPFKTAHGKALLATWDGKWAWKDKYDRATMKGGKLTTAPMSIHTAKMNKQLADFTAAEDVVYIIGHGAAGLEYIADVQDLSQTGATKVYPADLLGFLKTDLGLPETFAGKIKILACEAGAAVGGKSMLEATYAACKDTYPNAHFCSYTEVIFMGLWESPLRKIMAKGQEQAALEKRVGVDTSKPNPHANKRASTVRVWRCPGDCLGHTVADTA